jgi:hypothetical protein
MQVTIVKPIQAKATLIEHPFLNWGFSFDGNLPRGKRGSYNPYWGGLTGKQQRERDTVRASSTCPTRQLVEIGFQCFQLAKLRHSISGILIECVISVTHT